MTLVFLVLGTVIVVAVVGSLSWMLVRNYQRVRGERVVSCPDNGQDVAVRVDAARAALTPAGRPDRFRVESCTRWPHKAGCGQECLRQVEAQPDDCLVRTQLARWYADKSCVLCGKALGVSEWGTHPPAVRAPDGLTRDWSDVPPETLWGVLGTHSPVCWDCHIAETFRRKRPDLVIDNPNVTVH